MNLLGNHSCKLSSLSKEICAHCDCGTWTIWPQVAECESIGMTPSSKLGIHSWHPPRAPTQHPSQQNLKQVLSSKSKNKWHDVLVGCVSVCVCVVRSRCFKCSTQLFSCPRGPPRQHSGRAGSVWVRVDVLFSDCSIQR